MPYCQLFYHLVWATRHREPRLTLEIEPIVFGFLQTKAVLLGAQVFALNGIEDHVHMIASIPPRVALATFVGQVKGAAATRFNKAHPDRPPLLWQQEYGAFTLDAKRLPNHVQYVLHQKEHHRRGSVIPALERIGEIRTGSPPDAPSEEFEPSA